MTSAREIFISVDVETSGPIPGEYSMLSIGACLVDDDTIFFSALLKPVNRKADPKALEVTGLSLDRLDAEGEDPTAAMNRFVDWIAKVTPAGGNPVFVGLNAPFDWSFVNYYLHRFTGSNPFGFAALDIKAFYMGATGCSWAETKSSAIARELMPALNEALHDTQYQAELFRLARGLMR